MDKEQYIIMNNKAIKYAESIFGELYKKWLDEEIVDTLDAFKAGWEARVEYERLRKAPEVLDKESAQAGDFNEPKTWEQEGQE